MDADKDLALPGGRDGDVHQLGAGAGGSFPQGAHGPRHGAEPIAKHGNLET